MISSHIFVRSWPRPHGLPPQEPDVAAANASAAPRAIVAVSVRRASLIAVGSGGFTGVGLMESKQKLFYLPEAHTDFIFAVISEELGFIGAIVVIALFAVYGWRGLRAAFSAPDSFGRLLALGITAMVLCQALINFAVVLGMVPTKDSVFSDEAVSMKSLEYIFMGIPVVISKTKGHSYYYGDSMVKFFEPCNSGDLARAVIDLFRNRASREEQVRNSRRFIEENSWARVKKVYVEIAGSRSGESIS